MLNIIGNNETAIIHVSKGVCFGETVNYVKGKNWKCYNIHIYESNYTVAAPPNKTTNIIGLKENDIQEMTS